MSVTIKNNFLTEFERLTIPCLHEFGCVRYTTWSYEFNSMLVNMRNKEGQALLNFMAAERYFLRGIDLPETIAYELHLMRIDALCLAENFNRDLLLAELYCMAAIVAKHNPCPSLHVLENLQTPTSVNVITKDGTYDLSVNCEAPSISCETLRTHIATIAGLQKSCVLLYSIKDKNKIEEIGNDKIVEGAVYANVRVMPYTDHDLTERMQTVLFALNCTEISPRQLLFFYVRTSADNCSSICTHTGKLKPQSLGVVAIIVPRCGQF